MTLNNKYPIDNFASALISDIEQCLNQRKGSLHVKDYNIENGSPGLTLSNIICQVAGDRNGKESLTVQQKAEFRQWIEYLTIYGHLLQSTSTSHQVLKELNSVLKTKSYLTSFYRQTVIDAIFYRALHKIMSNLSYQEKEQFVHLSRWFSSVQGDPQTRGPRSIVTFSRNPLY